MAHPIQVSAPCPLMMGREKSPLRRAISFVTITRASAAALGFRRSHTIEVGETREHPDVFPFLRHGTCDNGRSSLISLTMVPAGWLAFQAKPGQIGLP